MPPSPRPAWLLPLAVLLIEAPLLWPAPHLGDWFYLWFAGHIVAIGGSPYELASWIPATRDYGAVPGGIAYNSIAGQDLLLATSDRWLWPPITAFLLAPFGALPLELGVPLVHLVTIAVCLASSFLLARALLPASVRPLGVAVAIASAPAVEVMRAGSPSAALLPAAALLFASLSAASAAEMSAGSIALSIRWSLFPLAACATTAALVARRAWRVLALAAAAWLVINGAAYALTPFSPAEIASASGVRAAQDNASTWRFAEVVAPGIGTALALVLALAAVALLAVAVRAAPREMRAETLIAGSLAVAIAVSPYVRTYDDLALLPSWFLVLRRTTGSGRYAYVTALVVGVVYGWVAYLLGVASRQEAGALSPFIALALLAAAASGSASRAPSSEVAAS